MSYRELNLDGLVGPTHNYAGLSFGNVASLNNQNTASNPREAALQGLAKMKALADRGFLQGVLPPHERPDLNALRQIGFSGNDAQVLSKVAKQAPRLLAACSSAAPMWVANAATVSSSHDSYDQRVHFTPANLVSHFHRSMEAPTTSRVLQAMFRDEQHFCHHQPLPAVDMFGDEGAANHTRLAPSHDDSGLELFVYGKTADLYAPRPRRYPARQTLEACQALARLHNLSQQATVFVAQNPAVIDQGVFHNDVISVGNENVLFFHQQAFLHKTALLEQLQHFFGNKPFFPIEIQDNQVPVADAVTSYLFNSQLLTRPDGKMMLVVPLECQQSTTVWPTLQAIVSQSNPIDEILVMDLRQSMRNGGGPACLRLRVLLSEQEQHAMNPAVLLTSDLYQQLKTWINQHYRDRISQQDLADPALLNESRQALNQLTQILQLGAVYPFQQ